MKRMRTTMIALAVSGSLVAGVTPAAMAQGPQGSGTTSASASATTSETTAAPTTTATTPAATTTATTPAATTTATTPAPLRCDIDPYTHFFKHTSGEWVETEERALDATPLTAEEKAKSEEAKVLLVKHYENVKGFGSGTTTPGCGDWEDTTTPAPSDKFDPRLLGIILPATLIIGGVIWYLSQDGKTYVQDPARANAQPTAEEQKASEQMLKDNADEVKRQAGAAGDAKSQAQDAKDAAAHGQRGMLAQTGNNDVARGLFALVLLSVVGAAAFLARRRFSA